MKKRCAVLIMFFICALISHVLAQKKITLVIASDNDLLPVLSPEETAFRDSLNRMYPEAVQYVSFTKITTFDFSTSDLVVACSDVIPKGFADTLVNRGVNVAFMGISAQSLGGVWDYRSLGYLRVTDTESFLSGYTKGPSFHSHSDFVYSNESVSIEGWTDAAISDKYPDQKVIFSTERNGIRGGVSGLDITKLTPVGWDMTRRMIRWCMNEEFMTPATVPQDSVALVITNLDDLSPVLTIGERILRDSLHSWGYNIHYISATRAGSADFSKAKFVAACVEVLSVGDADSLVNRGIGVVLFGSALNSIDPVGSVSSSMTADLMIDSSEAFLAGYPVGVKYDMCTSSSYCGDLHWSCLGSDSSRGIAFFKEVGQGRGAALGYSPRYLTRYGWDAARRMVKWITHEQVVDVKTIPSGHIAMVVYTLNESGSYLTIGERGLRDRILSQGEQITYVSSSKVTITDFTPSKLVVAASRTLSRNQHDSLLAKGVNVALFGEGILTMASNSAKSREKEKILKPTRPEAFLEGYLTGTSYDCGTSDLYTVGIPNVSEWRTVAKIAEYDILRYKEVNGARGAIFGLTPVSMTQFGNDVVRRMILWCSGNSAVDSLTVPRNNIAFVINGVDDTTPVLTSQEAKLDSFMRATRYTDISYISSTRLGAADLSGAKLVVESSMCMNKALFDTLAQKGLHMVLLGEAIRKFYWKISKDTTMAACSTVAYFEGLYPEMRVVRSSPVYAIDNYTPQDLTCIGFSGWDRNAFIYDKDGTRAAIAGVVPHTALSVDGWEIINRMFKWVERKSVVAPKEIKEGSIAFVISHPDDSAAVLDEAEMELRDSLISYGYDSISYVSKFRAEISDLSKSSFITSVNDCMSKAKLDSVLASSVPAFLFGSALNALPGAWYNFSLYSRTRVVSSTDYLAGYSSPLVYRFGISSQTVFTGTSLPGWRILGSDSSSSARHTLFSYEKDGVRAAAMSYSPDDLTSYGWDALQRALRWIHHQKVIDPPPVPKGNIAFIIYNMNDNDSTPSLTSAEKLVRDTLVSMRYKDITYVSSTRAGVTDFSQSKFVITTSNNLSKLAPDSLLNAGVNVVLLGAGLTTLCGDWFSQTYSYNLTPNYKAAFLDTFEVGNYYDCTIGGHYYPDEPANNVFGWTALGRDATASSTGHRVAFSTERDEARGAALGYFPEKLNRMGWNVFREMIRWTDDSPITIAAPSNGEVLEQNQTCAVEWMTRGEIDSVKISFSQDNGETFTVLAHSILNLGLFHWHVPNISSSSCILRVESVHNSEHMDEKYFTIGTAVGSGLKPQSLSSHFKTVQRGKSMDLLFSLARPTQVKADIYSISGRKAGSLDARLSTGHHSIDLLKGKPLARGTYILVVKLGSVWYRRSLLSVGQSQ